MIYTNKHSLPKHIELWLKYDSYQTSEDCISATRLLSPARQYALTKVHNGDLEVDVSDLIASRYGTAIHNAFEKVPMPNVDKEVRLFHELEVDGEKYKISGQFDMIKDMDKPVQTLIDIKSTSVWSYIFDSKNEDYIKQLSIYRYLANKSGKYNVGKDAEICMIFTDWSKKRSKKEANYPKLRVATKYIELWEEDKTEEFIKERLRLFKQATDELPLCTDEELWKTDDNWAVIKPWVKRAVRVCNSEQEAKDYLANKGLKKGLIHFRKGKAKRCNYCSVRKFCTQYIELVKRKAVDEE